MCFWLSTRTRKEGTFTICLPTLPSQRLSKAVCEKPLWRRSVQLCSGRLLRGVNISLSLRLLTLLPLTASLTDPQGCSTGAAPQHIAAC